MDLSWHNVSFRYTKYSEPVVDTVSLSLTRPGLYVVRGPSGSGKSTVLDLLAGLRSPTRGQVIVDGKRADRWSANKTSRWRARSVGYAPQAPNLLASLTCEENLELAVDVAAGGLDLTRRRALLDCLGMAKLASAYPSELSGGQRQRVAVAQALSSMSALLLMDEPVSSLDDANVAIVETLLRDAAGSGAMVVYCSHRELFGGAAHTLLDLGE